MYARDTRIIEVGNITVDPKTVTIFKKNSIANGMSFRKVPFRNHAQCSRDPASAVKLLPKKLPRRGRSRSALQRSEKG